MQHSVDFVRKIRAKFGIRNLLQSTYIGQNSDGITSDCQISNQSFVKENRHNSRTKYDIDITLGPVTERDKRNTTISKKIDDNFMSENCVVIVSFPIYG